MIDKSTDDWKGNPFKRRRSRWIEPGAVVLVGVLLVAGAGIEYEVYHLGYRNVLVIFAIFWVILIAIAMVLYRRSQYEVDTYVDRSILKRTRSELDLHRQETHKRFQETEQEVLRRGEKTNVLDVWRLRPSYREQHLYFSLIELTAIDPPSKEFHLRIQMGEIPEAGANDERLESKLLSDLLQFFKVISRDPPFVALARFFSTIILELYRLRTDDLHREVPVPLFSLEMQKSTLPKIASSGRVTLAQLRKMCDVRFDSGNPIVPHRGLESHGSRGAK